MAACDPGASLFDGEGEVRRLLRSVDWTVNPLGPVASWSPALRVMVESVLHAAFPMVINWGPEFIAIYNDAYVEHLGRRHPHSLARSAPNIWPEAWDWLGPRMERVVRDAQTLRFADDLQILQRNGYQEECYFTFSHSPVVDIDGSVGGVLTIAIETTRKRLSERRSEALRDLRELATTTDQAAPLDICRAALLALRKYRASVPFAAVFLAEAGGRSRLRDHYGFAPAAFKTSGGVGPVSFDEQLHRVIESGHPEVVTGLRSRNPGAFEPSPLGPLPPDVAVILPLSESRQHHAIGAVVLGVNPYRVLDEDFQDFLSLVGRQLRVALTDAAAQQSDRHRLEVMADLDRAKTEFFQNVSHELRTPLTLLLAPLQDLLAEVADEPGRRRDDLLAAVRAAQRLRLMVDALLDFSGAEAGILQPDQRPHDIGAITGEVASMFRSSAEHAGLRYVVDLPAAPLTAMVDKAMWSTVVTNLLSNAVKYTPSGQIEVRLRSAGCHAVLTISDTGLGIGEDEQGRVFDRFHRAAPSESGPGTGIGLALVMDLIRAHHGQVQLQSKPGSGTTVTVTVPVGVPPSPVPDQLNRNALESTSPRPGLLLVEDDADLRAYLTRLLTDDGWRVQAVPDAETALTAAVAPEARIDLVLTDVMLPRRSGLHLVASLRRSPRTARLPILVLTGRGGPDAVDQGLAAGADDYLTKPFSSGELLARVRASHELHQLRERAVHEAENRVQIVREGLESNRTIGAAVGIVMVTHRLTAEQGFRLLVAASQNLNVKLRDVAAIVTNAGALPFRPTVIDDLIQRSVREDGSAVSHR
jgi:signal transduction histidine kinase/DNA-binding response OmpR family regulator